MAQNAGEAIWTGDADFRQRRYESYDAYRTHQASAPEKRHDVGLKATLAPRLAALEPLMATDGKAVLCLGARGGAECEAFREAGMLAIGIDLDPGGGNRFVLTGDFHALQFPDDCFDIVFTNSLDHAFDLAKVADEARRVLKPGGLFVVEIALGSRDEGGREPGPYAATRWDHAATPARAVAARGFAQRAVSRFAEPWPGDQYVFARPAAVEPLRTDKPVDDPVGMTFRAFFDRFGASFRTKNFVGATPVEVARRLAVKPPAVTHSEIRPDFIRLDPWEGEYLAIHARRARTGILEIGRYNGGSTFLLSCVNQAVPIYSLDIAPQDDRFLVKVLAGAGVGRRTGLLLGDSQNQRHRKVGAFDLLFVDGDHSYAGCLADLTNWFDVLEPGGHILLHDGYAGSEVVDAVIDFADSHPVRFLLPPFVRRAHWDHPTGSMLHLQKTA